MLSASNLHILPTKKYPKLCDIEYLYSIFLFYIQRYFHVNRIYDTIFPTLFLMCSIKPISYIIYLGHRTVYIPILKNSQILLPTYARNRLVEKLQVSRIPIY